MGLIFGLTPLVLIIAFIFYRERKLLGLADRIFPEPGKLWTVLKEDWIYVISYSLIAYALPIMEFMNGTPRKILTYYTTQLSYRLLDLLGYELIPSPDPFVILTAVFRAKINGECSGLDAIAFFVAAFSALLIVDWKVYSKKTIFFVYVAGAVYMYLLNVLRISAIVMAANWATQKWGGERGTAIFLDLFHGHVGWISYVLGIALFFFVFFKIHRKRATHHG